MKNKILAGVLTVLFLTLFEGFDMKDWGDFGIHVPSSAAGEFYTQCPKCIRPCGSLNGVIATSTAVMMRDSEATAVKKRAMSW